MALEQGGSSPNPDPSTESKQDDIIAKLLQGIQAQADSLAVTLATDHYDETTRAVKSIDYAHHEIHGGSHFYYCDYDITPLGLGDTIEFVLTTSNTTKWIHLVFDVFSSTGATIELYEGASDVVGGTSVTPRNNNRNSDTVSTVTLVKDPTSITDGTRAAGFLAGANRSGGAVDREKEFVLKQNETYLLRITSLASSNNISWCAEWYEHSNSSNT